MTQPRPRAIAISYSLKDAHGNVLDTASIGQPLTALLGARTPTILPALEEALIGRNRTDQFTLKLTPEDAFGPHDPSKVRCVPREALQEPLPQFTGAPYADANDPETLWIVSKLDDTHVTLDANHPLAGQHLHLDVFVVQARKATYEEIRTDRVLLPVHAIDAQP